MSRGLKNRGKPLLASDVEKQRAIFERERVVLEHRPLVRSIARQLHARLPKSVNVDDLVSAGMIALIESVDRFDPTLGVTLANYAKHRIRGAIVDSLRKDDRLSRLQRKRLDAVESCQTSLEQKLGRLPSDQEIAAELGLDLQTYYHWLLFMPDAGRLELEHIREGVQRWMPARSRSPMRYTAVRDEEDPENKARRAELQEFLSLVAHRLPVIEQNVLRLYYESELTYREISAIVSLPPSSVARIRRIALETLRSNFDPFSNEPRSPISALAEERSELVMKKYERGLSRRDTRRLEEIEQLIQKEEEERASRADASEVRFNKIESALDRVEAAIAKVRGGK